LWLVSVGALLGALSGSAMPQEHGTTVAPPTNAEVEKAEKTLRQLFKTEYARRLRAQPAALALAKTLLDEAKVTNDSPPLKFTALREAAVLALLGDDLRSGKLPRTPVSGVYGGGIRRQDRHMYRAGVGRNV